jgi:trimeric autotransporter adhesin
MKTHKRGLLVSSSNVALRTGAAIMTLWIASLASEAIAQNTVVAGNQDDGTGFPTICAGADDNVLVGRVVKIGCNTDSGVAIGLSSDIGDDSTGAIAIGQSSSVLDNSQQAIAIGTAAQTNGDGSVAIGVQSFVGTLSTAARSGVAIGVQASVSADFGIALGVQSSVGSSANNSVTIGSQSRATGSRSVVLGSNSSDGGQSDVVAVGSIGGGRKIINMRDGLIANGSSEAVNGSQLFSTNSAIAATLGGGAVINTTTGAITGPVFNVAGGSFTNVGAALAALDNINVNAIVYDNVAKTAATLGAVGGSTPVALRNLAAGVLTVNSREAVNGSQLFATNTAIASAMGAGSGVNGTTGAITGPTFTVVGGTFNNVGAALDIGRGRGNNRCFAPKPSRRRIGCKFQRRSQWITTLCYEPKCHNQFNSNSSNDRKLGSRCCN